MIFAAQKIAKEDPDLAENIGLLLVVSEELDHIGMVVCLLQNILRIHERLIIKIFFNSSFQSFLHERKNGSEKKKEKNGNLIDK